MKKNTGKQFSFLKNPFLKKGFWTLLAFCFLVAVWWIAELLIGNAYLLPPFIETVKAGIKELASAEFWTAFFATLLRVFTAFVLSFVFASILAVVSYTVGWFGDFLAPMISFLRSLPTMAVLLMILLWTNAGKAPIVVACLVLFPLLYASVLSALSGVDKGLVEMSAVYGVPKGRMIRSLYIPSVLPTVCKESSASLSFALKLVVSAEVMANTFQSIGGKMQTADLYAQTPTLFALTFIVFLTGYALECLGLFATHFIERGLQ